MAVTAIYNTTVARPINTMPDQSESVVFAIAATANADASTFMLSEDVVGFSFSATTTTAGAFSVDLQVADAAGTFQDIVTLTDALPSCNVFTSLRRLSPMRVLVNTTAGTMHICFTGRTGK